MGQTIRFPSPPRVLSYACVGGKQEWEGPLGKYFDLTFTDDSLGCPTWEQAEQSLQQRSLTLALTKGGLTPAGLDALFAGDLLNQCTASSYAARGRDLPYFGLCGACSTMGEGLILASMGIAGGFLDRCAVTASSHFCTAERQYRTPLEYGGQRPPTAQWTVTGAGCLILGREGAGPRITHATPGKIVDLGVTDACNMGAAMAPAAADTILAHLADTGRSPAFYDLIVTGDLGRLGSRLLLDLLEQEGITLSNHTDCGCLIYHPGRQDVHSGGSGCGCCAGVLCAHILPGLEMGRWKNILFCPTGALHSPTLSCQGESIPGICHGVVFSTERGD